MFYTQGNLIKFNNIHKMLINHEIEHLVLLNIVYISILCNMTHNNINYIMYLEHIQESAHCYFASTLSI